LSATLEIPGYKVGTWTLDPAHSEVSFTVRHLAISKVRGVFKEFEATITTPENPLEASVVASADVASIDTKNADRDAHLRTGDFFLAEEHPKITFVSTGVRQEGDDFYVDGDLTIRGVTKPVSFKTEFGGFGNDPWGGTRAGLTATTKVNREDFGLTWNAPLETGGFLLGNDVTITLDFQAVLQQEAPQA